MTGTARCSMDCLPRVRGRRFFAGFGRAQRARSHFVENLYFVADVGWYPGVAAQVASLSADNLLLRITLPCAGVCDCTVFEIDVT